MLHQIDPKTNEVQNSFTDAKHAASFLQVSSRQIRRAMSGVQATAYGSKWSCDLPTEKSKVRARLNDINLAKELSEAHGGHWKDYFKEIK